MLCEKNIGSFERLHLARAIGKNLVKNDQDSMCEKLKEGQCGQDTEVEEGSVPQDSQGLNLSWSKILPSVLSKGVARPYMNI